MQQYKIFCINAGSYKIVNLDNNETLVLKAAGKLRYLNTSPIVGDNVKISNQMINEILPRRNFLIRPKIANIDQIIICMSILKPDFSSFLLDKYLSILEAKNIRPIIFITKSDLELNSSKIWQETYQKMGYEVHLINNSLDFDPKLKNIFLNKFSAFMGQSGVGKTTTLNKLTNLNFATQEISKALDRGKHTTRIVQIIKFNQGYLIDTPGFSSVTLDLDKIELAQSFKLFKTLAQTCKFRSCLHLNEASKDCAIKQAVDNNLIPQFRYQNYIKLQNELTLQK